MWHFRYPVAGEQAEYITVATTRPETMLGDTAVAVHPEDERYKDMIGKSVSLPITGRLIPIVADEYADPEQGSGAVKITPAHDFNDFEVGKRHDLPMINVFDRTAHILPLEDIPKKYHGLDRFAARKEILKDMEDLDALVEVETIKHTVPYGDRSGVIIEPFLTDQWYCDAPKMAVPAIEAVESGKMEFVPKNWENTYFEWMRNIQPWCISRQLWWGHQIPAWYGPDGHIFVAESEDEAYKQADAHYGESVTLTRDEDVLDTWFSSALWPFSTLGWPDKTPELEKYYPGDVLLTAFDIIFFWVARMMMMGLHFMGDVPFKKVYIHALIRDAKGQKMSKSKGNIIDPLDLIDKYGTDALRFTLTAMAAQGRDIKLSEQRVEGYRHFATKLWNAARYCQMNGCAPAEGFDPGSVQYTPNKWIVAEVAKTKEAMEQGISSYRFNDAAQAIYQFAWGTFCDWYLEFTKPLLQASSDVIPSEVEGSQVKDGDSSAAALRTSAQNDNIGAEIKATTAWVLDQILTLLNPVMPYITEELYASMGQGNRSPLIESSWPEYPKGAEDESDAVDTMDWLMRVIGEIRSVRADMNVPASAKIQLLIKDADDRGQANLKAYEEIIKRMARIDNIEIVDGFPKGSVQAVVGKATLGLPIAEIIDLDSERARLRKQIAKLEQDIKKVDQKLGNKKFLDNAPEDVIAEQHQRKTEAETTRDKLLSALKQLDEAA